MSSIESIRDRVPGNFGRIMAAFRRNKAAPPKRTSGAIMIRTGTYAAILILSFTVVAQSANAAEGAAYDGLVARHAAANGVPESLVRRVIMRESRYNPRAVSKGNYGMMQIRLGTARAMGYSGGAAGLLDADTNMTYAVRYLAGAYRAAGGNHDRAVMNYARGYYHTAKAQGFSPYAQQSSYALAGIPASYTLAGAPALSTNGVRGSYALSANGTSDALVGVTRKGRRALQRQAAEALVPYSRYDREPVTN
jgi:soluble lytic murein transglycosylase-like protein